MKCLVIFTITLVVASIYATAKPLISVDSIIPPIPIVPAPPGVESATVKSDSSSEVETMDKSESVVLGYYPYYYGWPYYGYRYPLVYVG